MVLNDAILEHILGGKTTWVTTATSVPNIYDYQNNSTNYTYWSTDDTSPVAPLLTEEQRKTVADILNKVNNTPPLNKAAKEECAQSAIKIIEMILDNSDKDLWECDYLDIALRSLMDYIYELNK